MVNGWAQIFSWTFNLTGVAYVSVNSFPQIIMTSYKQWNLKQGTVIILVMEWPQGWFTGWLVWFKKVVAQTTFCFHSNRCIAMKYNIHATILVGMVRSLYMFCRSIENLPNLSSLSKTCLFKDVFGP